MQAAAALLLMLQQLPSSFMPTEVNAVLKHCIPASSACQLMLSDAMSAVEWATFRHILSLLKAALEPEAVAANRLSVYALAAVLAEFCFKGLGSGECCVMHQTVLWFICWLAVCRGAGSIFVAFLPLAVLQQECVQLMPCYCAFTALHQLDK